MTRKVLKYNAFKPITKFLKKFNLKSFVNKKKIPKKLKSHISLIFNRVNIINY